MAAAADAGADDPLERWPAELVEWFAAVRNEERALICDALRRCTSAPLADLARRLHDALSSPDEPMSPAQPSNIVDVAMKVRAGENYDAFDGQRRAAVSPQTKHAAKILRAWAASDKLRQVAPANIAHVAEYYVLALCARIDMCYLPVTSGGGPWPVSGRQIFQSQLFVPAFGSAVL